MAFLVYPANPAIPVIQIDADDYEHVTFLGGCGTTVEHGFKFTNVDERVPKAYFSASDVVGIVKT